MKSKTFRKVPDAPESNAGDDFHILWTMRKALSLLNIKENKTRAITVEGVVPEESELDEFGDKFLGIDVGEYIEGDTFEEASQIIFSQLKYSTRHATKAWTLSRICKGKTASNYSGSIIRKLSTIYKVYCDEYGSEVTNRKLRLKLVSNQPVSQDVLDFIIEFKIAIKDSILLKSLKKTANYKLIKLASGITESQLYDLIFIIDFEDCGTQSRKNQKDLIFIEVAKLNSFESRDQYNRLHILIKDKMLPEGIQENKITKEDVLHCFNFNSIEQLFPAPSNFSPIPNVVKREQIEKIAEKIASNNKFICLHAGAGMGKSTIARSIPEYLPEGSVSIVFDCYGNGSYSQASDKRHKHEWGLTQICNELTIQSGTPLLLQWQKQPEVYIREFLNRLKLCSDIVLKQNPNAIILIIIDAADNSVAEASSDKSQSFVLDLIKENKLPPRCKLALTSRSHRVASLCLTSQWELLEIDPFSLAETRSNFRFYFPSSTEKEVVEFHTLTKQIPRVQSYSLGKTQDGIDAVIQPLMPDGMSLEDIMKQQVAIAIAKAGDNNVIPLILTLLVNLPRPIPIKYLTIIADCNFQILEDLGTDLWTGLVCENDTFSFKDEDFEEFLRNEYPCTTGILNSIADCFLIEAVKDEYASINLANILIDAKRFDKLNELILDKKLLDYPKDPIRNKETFMERTMLAMKYSHQVNDDGLTFLKLQLIAAEAAKTDKILKDVLINNAELTAAYGDIKTVQKIYFQSEQNTWYGPVHYKSAAVFSRNSNTYPLAKKHLELAESWIGWRNRLSDEKRRDYQLHPKDLSYGAEAYLRLYGISRVTRWFRSWNSREYMLNVITPLIFNILSTANADQIKEWATSSYIRIDIRVIIACYSIKENIDSVIEMESLRDDLIILIKKKKSFPIDFFLILIEFCEYLIIYKIENEKLLFELDKLKPPLPQSAPRFYSHSGNNEFDKKSMDANFEIDFYLATVNDTILPIDHFYPDKLKEEIEENDTKTIGSVRDKKSEFDRLYKHLTKIYQARCKYLLKKITEDELLTTVESFCKELKDDYDFTYYSRHNLRYTYRFIAEKFINLLPFVGQKEKLIKLLKEYFTNKGPDDIFFQIEFASVAANTKSTKELAVILMREAEVTIQKSSMSGSSKTTHFVSLSIIANRCDQKVAKYYFDKIVEAASDIDIAAFNQIKCISNLSKIGIENQSPKLAFEYNRFIEYCNERLSGYEDFPWNEAINGVTRIDNSTGFAVLCRWDHKGLVDLEKYFLNVLQIALDNSHIDVTTASSFLPVYKYFGNEYLAFVIDILKKFDVAFLFKEKNGFIKNLVADLKINIGYHTNNLAKEILMLLKSDLSIDANILSDLDAYVTFVFSTNVTNYTSDIEPPTFQKAITLPLSSEIDVTSTESIEKAILLIRPRYDNFPPRQEVEDLLESIKNSCDSSNYIAHLDALLNLNQKIVSFFSFEQALKQRLSEWDYYFEVRIWKEDSFEKFLKLWIQHFIWNDYLYIKDLESFAKLFNISNEKFSLIIEKILPEFIEVLSGPIIYQFLDITAAHKSSNQIQTLITWALERWNKNIKYSLYDGDWQPMLAPPTNITSVVGSTYRYLLANSEKEIRWRALHSLRRLVEMGKTDIIVYLLDNQDETNCLAFQYNKYTYYWMSGQLWLWILIDKIVDVYPNALFSMNRKIIELILNPKLKHALISYFKKRVGLKLFSIDAKIFRSGERKLLENILINNLPPIVKDRPYNGFRERHERKKLKFDYDFMDTIPYWYEPLGTQFGLSGEEIAELTDKIIVNEWKFIGKSFQENHVSRGEYSRRSKDHGTVPKVEDLQTYYEYHAMFVVAENLIKNERLVKNESSRRDFTEWLSGYALAWDNNWLSDLRDSTPLEKYFWESNISNENWFDSIAIDEVEKHFCFKKIEGKNFFPVMGNYSSYMGKDHETVYFTSALVSTKTSAALLNAFQTAKNPHDYYIPLEKEYDQMEIAEFPFVLKGWLKSFSNENSGIDSNDPFAQNWMKHAIGFGSDFCNWSEVTMSGDFRKYKKKKTTNELIGLFESWSNVSDRRSYGNFECEGQRLLINDKELFEYLKHEESCLILECSISKWKEHSYNNTSKNIGTVKFFLINSDGTIKSFSGSNQIR